MCSRGLSCISDLAQNQQFKTTSGEISPNIIGNKIQEEIEIKFQIEIEFKCLGYLPSI